MRSFIIHLTLGFGIVLFLNSCSLFKVADRHIKGKLKRSGLKFKTLVTPDYILTYWDTENTQKPVYVLLHGFGSSTRFQWHEQARKLCKTHRLILPNLLHFGSNPKKKGLYHISDQVAAISTLIEQLDIDTMVLGGISYGGVVAAELARKQPEKIQKLTIFSSPVKYFEIADLERVEKDYKLDDLGDLLVPEDYKDLRKLFKLTMYKSPALPNFVLKDMHQHLYSDSTNNNGQRELLNAMRADAALLANQVYAFQFPVLLVWGAADQLIPPRIGRQLQEHIPNAALHMIPKAGHAPCIEQKRKFNKILLDFLEEKEDI